MVGDDAANAVITWLSRDSFVPILFRRLKPVYGITTRNVLFYGILIEQIVTPASSIAPVIETVAHSMSDGWTSRNTPFAILQYLSSQPE
jgi:hypothetical protein